LALPQAWSKNLFITGQQVEENDKYRLNYTIIREKFFIQFDGVSPLHIMAGGTDKDQKTSETCHDGWRPC
jgi:hypothetical protein